MGLFETFPKLPTYNFEWVEDISQFNEVFIKNYDEKSKVGYILEVDVHYPEKAYELYSDLPFLPERKKLRKSKSFLLVQKINVNMLFI